MAEFFSHPVPAAVVLLGLLVFFHELGHYLVGLWSGIAVETFSIRRPAVDDPNVLGPLQKISEKLCTGPCQ